MTTPETTRRRAYARAGEAVVRHTQGRPLPTLTLEPAPPPTGRGGPDSPYRQVDLGSRARHQVEREMLAQWAGLLAESRACCEGQPPAEGWGPVREHLADLGRRITRSDAENDAYLEWLRLRALALIEIPEIWAAIEAVAAALAAEGRLDAGRTEEVITATYRSRRKRTGVLDLFRFR